jgi:hypothetical protein
MIPTAWRFTAHLGKMAQVAYAPLYVVNGTHPLAATIWWVQRAFNRIPREEKIARKSQCPIDSLGISVLFSHPWFIECVEEPVISANDNAVGQYWQLRRAVSDISPCCLCLHACQQ